MRTFQCECGNTLFFDSTHCLQCNRATARCASCESVAPLNQVDGAIQCGQAACAATLRLCENNSVHNACNGSVVSDASTSARLCSFCQLNTVIPDLSVPSNLDKWRKLEAAKHRVLAVVKHLGFPLPGAGDQLEPKLQFQFKSDQSEPVVTGHADGCITINLREADSVEREKTRVQFDEPQRTLVGHFRHELGHYYWQLLVKNHCLGAYRDVFGEETNPAYESARQRYYETGPPANWQDEFISAYASMHSWEDFAETFSSYLDMASILLTTNHFGFTNTPLNNFDMMLTAYRQIAVVANEMNRDIGLLDLVPETIAARVADKLRFVHRLRADATPAPV